MVLRVCRRGIFYCFVIIFKLIKNNLSINSERLSLEINF